MSVSSFVSPSSFNAMQCKCVSHPPEADPAGDRPAARCHTTSVYLHMRSQGWRAQLTTGELISREEVLAPPVVLTLTGGRHCSPALLRDFQVALWRGRGYAPEFEQLRLRPYLPLAPPEKSTSGADARICACLLRIPFVGDGSLAMHDRSACSRHDRRGKQPADFLED